MKKPLWIIWILLSISIASYYAFIILADDQKSELLIGESTYGHYQIELSCSSCHTDPFGGPEVLQDACMNCHEEELTQAFDAHPKKKFTDPRNSDLVKTIDARYCVSCHTEHQQEQTLEMGLTLPSDYCFHCHLEIGEERPSHKDLPFDSCASAGCHNFHDNRALYEAFLVANADQPWLKEIATITTTNYAKLKAAPATPVFDISHPNIASEHQNIAEEWQHSAHATAGVSCVGCHNAPSSSEWIDKPTLNQCRTCHETEVKGFTSGKHGMRLAQGLTTAKQLPAISPRESDLSFQEDSLDIQHGCNSCHAAHDYDTKVAKVDSCLGCHSDEHSLAFESSPHGALWQKELTGEISTGEGVTCATCHMPRLSAKEDGTILVRTEHNQNLNLRPNEKMIRPICMQCHSLEFSIDALADENLINSNFNGSPSTHVPSIDWAKKRDKR